MKPNILFIYPDQMRYDCMSHSGHPLLKTPAIDRLAEEGVSFTHAFTAFPLCCPFRASVMTGKYPTSHGMIANHYPIRLNQDFLPAIMRENGYNTCWVGKWHLNGGKKHDFVPVEYRLGFEHFIGFSRGHEYLSPIYYRDNDPTPLRSDMFEPEMQTGHLCDYIDESLNETRPFFAAIGYGPPHVPVDQSPDYYKHLFTPDEIQLSGIVPESQTEEAKTFIAKYYGLVTAIDNQVHHIISHLENRGILDDTMIIFVSDHGDMCYEHGLTGKKTFYNGSMHVPFIIRYPKQYRKGEKENHIVDPSVDIMPTILEACGIDIPFAVEGQSLHTLLTTGDDVNLNDYVYYQIPKEEKGPEKHPWPERGLRTDDWLYVERDGIPYALFDLINDPDEQFNLASNASYYSMIQDYHQKLQKVMDKYHDSWDIHADFPPVNFQTHEEGRDFNKTIYEKAVYETKHFPHKS